MPDDLSFFMADNVEAIEPVEIAVSKRIKDKDGNPVMWKLRPVPTELANKIENECIEVRGIKRNFNLEKYTNKICAAAVVYPDLYNADLQDSWGVKKPEDLLVKILSDKGEFEIVRNVATSSLENEEFEKLVDEAKN